MQKIFLAAAPILLACLALLPARADTTITITTNNASCRVTKPEAVTDPATPSVPAGNAAMENRKFAMAEANFRPLADKGDVKAERSLGQLLMQDCTGLQDKEAALSWLTKAADGGDVIAERMLGDAYMNGEGTAEDDTKAFALLTKAANTNDVPAERSLGYLYLTGRAGAVELYEGMLWTIRAGQQGDATALSNIATGYLNGKALPQDLDKAAFYIAVAMQRANGPGRAHIVQTNANIARKVSQDDMEHGARRAKDWAPGEDSLSEVIKDAARQRGKNS